MNYFIFKVGVKNNDVEVRTYKLINNNDIEYIKYDKFLKKSYFTNIAENDDYIPMLNKNEVLIILREEQFKITDLEDVFEILYDSLYVRRGAEYEENINY